MVETRNAFQALHLSDPSDTEEQAVLASDVPAADAADFSTSLQGERQNSAAARDHKAGTMDVSAAESRKQPSTHKQPLFWLDLEMTGLDLSKPDTIIEIACLITNGQLQDAVEGPATAIHQPEAVLDSMNDWCLEHHAASGLTQRVRDSCVSMQEAEDQVLAFLQHHVPEPRTALLAGNSVHVDLAFLRLHMPRLVAHLHYRIVDVSSVGELCRRWYPKVCRKAPKKQHCHTAQADILESLEELRFYRERCFRLPTAQQPTLIDSNGHMRILIRP